MTLEEQNEVVGRVFEELANILISAPIHQKDTRSLEYQLAQNRQEIVNRLRERAKRLA